MVENFIRCEIKDIVQFRVCLESVKFPKSGQVKNQFNVSTDHLLADLILYRTSYCKRTEQVWYSNRPPVQA